ncbi:Male salivary gland protein 3 [Frankliniella occidentalis]|nr:Male salivary gland protein 3 [Frankliniella occidentalis]
MYTNAANLQHTIEVQQELFRQSLRQTTPTSSSRPQLPLPDAKMEWKVKRRADGSRYITRRPVRTRVIREALRDRAAQLRDERAGFSTEDDTASELKMGRYWTKAERKQHVRRKRQQEILQVEQPKPQPKQSQLNEEDAGRRPLNTVDLSHKKMTRKKSNVDDFTAVQELLAKGSTASTNAKLLGLLSVTTV